MQWLTEVNFSVKLTFKVFTNGKFSKWNKIFLECDTCWVIFLKSLWWDLPGDTVVKNPPAPMWEASVQSLIQDDPTCWAPVAHNHWACALGLRSSSAEHMCHNCWSLCALESVQQEKPPQWEACTLEQSSPCSIQLEKSPCSNKDPAQPKMNK